jgi:prepilin-type N-terminal cleavage/methylation domain-containing protein
MKLKTGEKGFTLVELLVALSIATFVTAAASMTIITMMRLSPRTNNWAIALHQVQNAGYWISRDIQMSQGTITIGSGNPTFLTLTVPQDSNPANNKQITYEFPTMYGGQTLMRKDSGQQIMIAEYISYANAPLPVYDTVRHTYTLTVTITATSGDVPVTRDYKAVQRVSATSP